MAVLMVPDDDGVYWPSLGGLVCGFIEENLVFGPGDLRGQPAVLDDDKRALIWRLYEVYSQGSRDEEGKDISGRRRFKQGALVEPKGVAKTELGAWIVAAELHPAGPVRCVGWDRRGHPQGGPVTDPYIPMVAYTEEQSDELCYGALKVILEQSGIARDFDIGEERIMRRGGDGKAVSLSMAPDARDGARTTFSIEDETHRFTSERQRMAHQTMMANLPKRYWADAWNLQLTTAPAPGEKSVAENTIDYAKALKEGRIKEKGTRMFFFWQFADEKYDIEKEADVRAGLIDASGAAAGWRDIDSMVELWRDPTTDRAYFERVYFNRLVKSSLKAFDIKAWKERKAETSPVKDGDLITLGFDGAMFFDSTGLVATHVETGYQWVVGSWECPFGKKDWKIEEAEVDDAVSSCFQRWEVWRMYADPPYWQSWLAQWAAKWTPEKVVEWWTNRPKQMAYALEAYETAIATGELSHDGRAVFERHVGNAFRHDLRMRNEEDGKPLWNIRKERGDSPNKIDVCMAAVLSWEARMDAVKSGATGRSVYDERGPLIYSL